MAGKLNIFVCWLFGNLGVSTSWNSTSLVAWWSEFLTTNHEVPGSIPGSTICVFP